MKEVLHGHYPRRVFQSNVLLLQLVVVGVLVMVIEVFHWALFNLVSE